MRIPSLSPTRRKHAGHQIITFIRILVQIIAFTVVRAVDFEFPSQQISELAFGSCHKAKSRKKQHLPHTHKNAFRNIPKHIPVWLWTGDAIYPPMRGIAPVELLRREYDNMKANATLGYGEFIRNKIVLGTWDDHESSRDDVSIHQLRCQRYGKSNARSS
ncbi:hypothetical protein MPSEU_000531700 [Mayamaea pseudoterrestris]|nr:hypothetical protein MPSEU_000531700 [Mayamaea pseudoterrestris]